MAGSGEGNGNQPSKRESSISRSEELETDDADPQTCLSAAIPVTPDERVVGRLMGKTGAHVGKWCFLLPLQHGELAGFARRV